MDFFERRTWSWLSLGAVTDEAVHRTSAVLGLGAP
jgi:hypothetical protein